MPMLSVKNACDIVLRSASPETVCGLARSIGREGEARKLLTLGELKDTETDMFTTVFVGNSSSEVIGDRFVTRRGYREKQDL